MQTSHGLEETGGHDEVRPFAAARAAVIAKRAVDIVGAAVALIVFAPILLVAAVAVRLTTPGPALYRGQRIGRDGRPFTMHKLRTMYIDADRQLVDLLHLNLARGMVKIPDDPRRTPIGRFLRRMSIDELPQLWDVLRGEMSLVGPRPHVPDELDENDPMLRARTTVKPGMTGLWQVSARTHPDIETRVHYDLEYIRSWSLLSDIRILLRTVPAVLRADGGTASPHPVRAAILELPAAPVAPQGGQVPPLYDAYFGETVGALATETRRVDKLDLG